MLPEIIGGKYRVLRELGRGGMGVLYVVEHQGTGEQLALKLMNDRALASPKAIERFKREAKAPARIKTEHVVRVYDADTAPELDGAPFLVMELLEGDNLETLSASAPEPAVVVDWLRQAAKALDRAHALGLVHRDLKPENLFLARRPEQEPIVKVLDFGIVKMLQDSDGTDSGVILGTPRYMSPEQVLAELGAVGPSSDVWAMGLVALRLLSGREYWTGDNTVAVVAEILHGKMPPPSERGCDLGPAFDTWFLRSCDRDAKKRFPTVGEQIEELANSLRSQSGAIRRPAKAAAIGHASTLPVGSTGASRLGPASARDVTAGASIIDRTLPTVSRRPVLLAAVAAVAVGVPLWVAFSGGGPSPNAPLEPAATIPAAGDTTSDPVGVTTNASTASASPTADAADTVGSALVLPADTASTSAVPSATAVAGPGRSPIVRSPASSSARATPVSSAAPTVEVTAAPSSKPRGPTDDPL